MSLERDSRLSFYRNQIPGTNCMIGYFYEKASRLSLNALLERLAILESGEILGYFYFAYNLKPKAFFKSCYNEVQNKNELSVQSLKQKHPIVTWR